LKKHHRRALPSTGGKIGVCHCWKKQDIWPRIKQSERRGPRHSGVVRQEIGLQVGGEGGKAVESEDLGRAREQQHSGGGGKGEGEQGKNIRRQKKVHPEEVFLKTERCVVLSRAGPHTAGGGNRGSQRRLLLRSRGVGPNLDCATKLKSLKKEALTCLGPAEIEE